MSRYIDIEPVIKHANEEITAPFAYPQGGRADDEKAYREKWDFVRTILLNTPAADVVEVVRCADCRFLTFSDMYGECSKGIMGVVTPNDYCSRGERRDG